MSDGSGPLTQEQALALIERTTDRGWFVSMQATPDGQAILAALTAPLAAASEALMRQVAACSIGTAPTGSPGACELRLTRPTSGGELVIPRGFTFVDGRDVRLVVPLAITVLKGQTDIYLPLVTLRKIDLTNNSEPAFDDLLDVGDLADPIIAPENATAYGRAGGAVTLTRPLPGVATPGTFPAGSIVATAGGVEFETDADAVFGDFDTSVPVNVTAVEAGTSGNVLAATITVFVTVPFDATLTVSNTNPTAGGDACLPGAATYVSSTAITGATMDWLSAHGQERGCYRQPNEEGEAYRLRVRAIPDAATPKAVLEAVHGAQSQSIVPTVYAFEPYLDQASAAARLTMALSFADSPCDGDYLDDPLGVNIATKFPWRRLELTSKRTGRAYFRLAFAKLVEADGSGCYLDDAYCDDPEWGYPDMGLHPELKAALRAIHHEADRKRAAGVQFDVYADNASMRTNQVLGWAYPAGSLFWTWSVTAGKVWLIRAISITPSGYPGVHGYNPATDSYKLEITLASGVVLTTGWLTDPAGKTLRTFELEDIGYYHEPVTAIRYYSRNTVAKIFRICGWSEMVELTL